MPTIPPTQTKIARLARSSATLAVAAALLTACVTVNVNFPESAVQKATDDYVRDLYRAKEKGKTPAAPAPEASKTSHRSIDRREQNIARPTTVDTQRLTVAHETREASAFAAWLDGIELVPAAHAEVDIKVNSPKSLAIKQKLAARVDEVIAQKRAGVLGETSDGLLELKGADKVKPLLKQKISGLVSAENADRMDLYGEVATANNIPHARIKDIQKSFARSFQAESPSGTWLQDDAGRWTQKP